MNGEIIVRRVFNAAGMTVLLAFTLIAGQTVLAANDIRKELDPQEAVDSETLRDDVAESIMRDLDLSRDQLLAYREKERLALETGPVIQEALGEDFAGYYLERRNDKTFAVVVAVKAGSKRNPQALERVDHVKQVRFSLNELRDIEKRVFEAVKSLDSRKIVQSLEVVIPDNIVELSVDVDTVKEGQSFVDASGVDRTSVRIVPKKGRPAPTAYGGDAYNMSPTGSCSVGFGAYTENQWGFLTAGHCGDVGTQVLNLSNQVVGYFQQSNFSGSDYGWVHITTNQFPADPYVNRYGTSGGQPQPVYGNRELPLGSVVCRSGKRTEYQCGQITSTYVNAFYTNPAPGQWVYGLRKSSACTGPGDSGGSVISSTGEAQGINSGGSNFPGEYPNLQPNCGQPNPVSYYVPLQQALDGNPNVVLWAVVSCMRLNSGYRVGGTGPNVRGSIDGCGSPYKVAINPSNGWVTMYHYGSPTYPFANVGAGGYLWMQKDGNLVARTASGQAVWEMGTSTPGSEARLGENAELRVYDRNGGLKKIFCASSQQFTNCYGGGGY